MKGNILKQKLVFLKSMGFGILLLALILVLSAIGTILPQGYEEQFYTETYSEYLAEIMILFQLDHIYTSLLFSLLFIALAVNLLLCSTSRLGRIIIRIRQRYNIDSMKEISSCKHTQYKEQSSLYRYIFRAYGAAGFFKYKYRNGMYYSSKNVIGYFGSWFLHLGIMLVILFYIYGQATFYSEDIYGTPGEVAPLKGTDYSAAIQAFNVSYRENGSVEQYTTELELLDKSKKQLKRGSLNVNNPMRFGGYSLYQTSMGWAGDCKVFKEAVLLKSEIIYEKSASIIPEENIAIALARFYPDFAVDDNGFGTLSDLPNNPALLYSIYYRGELVKMDIVQPGDPIKWNEYSFSLDNFRRYTYIKVNKMNGQEGAAVGGALIIIGLALTFYFKPMELILKQEGERLYIYGKTEPDGSSANALKVEDYLNNKEEGINV